MNLPPELLCLVSAFLEPHDMARLCLVSKQWKELWTPLLYAHVVANGNMLGREITCDWEDFDGEPDIASSLRKYASLIRSLSFSRFMTLEFDCLMACLSYPGTIDNTISNSRALSVAHAAGLLTRITLTKFEPTSRMMNTLLKEQPNLREIALKPEIYNLQNAYTFEELFKLLPEWKQLETFKYSSSRNLHDIPFKHIVEFLSRCPTLRRLVLLGPIIEGFDDLGHIEKFQYQFPPLITLELSSFAWFHIPVISGIHPALSYLLRHLPTLQYLSVRSQVAYEHARTPTNQTWRYGLANNRALKKIEIINGYRSTGREEPSVACSAVVEAISNLYSQSLTSIRLESAYEETSDEAFVELFRCCQNLQHISLTESKISDVALDALAVTQERLARLHPRPIGLQSLSLRYCYNISAAPLARILYCCQDISLLSILDCPPIALGLFTRPIISDDRGQRVTTSATATDSPSNGLWACTKKLKKLQLKLNTGRYRDEVAQESDDGPPIPDGFTNGEMDLIRRQLDALVRLEELRLEGDAMSYDLLMVPQSPHCHPSESTTLSHSSLRSDGRECTTTHDGENPEVKGLEKREYRAIRPLLTGCLTSVFIRINIYPAGRNFCSNEVFLKELEAIEWWKAHANALFRKGKIDTDSQSLFPKISFRVDDRLEAFN